jgi:hypothetical protein
MCNRTSTSHTSLLEAKARRCNSIHHTLWSTLQMAVSLCIIYDNIKRHIFSVLSDTAIEYFISQHDLEEKQMNITPLSTLLYL